MAFSKLGIALTAVASALSINLASAADVASGAPILYGRAGQLVGSDRVMNLQAGKAPLSVSYDHEVAARTNMATDRATGKRVGVSYDAEYAARTNMPRGGNAAYAGNVPANSSN